MTTWNICHKSGRVLFTTNDERTAMNRAKYGWRVEKLDKHFEVGETWLSPRGYFYKVVDVQNNHAILKMGTHGLGRKIKRRKDATKNWQLHVETLK